MGWHEWTSTPSGGRQITIPRRNPLQDRVDQMEAQLESKRRAFKQRQKEYELRQQELDLEQQKIDQQAEKQEAKQQERTPKRSRMGGRGVQRGDVYGHILGRATRSGA